VQPAAGRRGGAARGFAFGPGVHTGTRRGFTG
jgi:hypothetical protein